MNIWDILILLAVAAALFLALRGMRRARRSGKCCGAGCGCGCAKCAARQDKKP
ncbi:MAG: FeoB-associated Cys-rich membrane protein [Clostridia bacterium]|nr:FeoB-associated Cys-rich membrane protein [Clostridia bacterium]